MRLKLYKAQCSYCFPGYMPKDVRPATECVKLPSGLYACVMHVSAMHQAKEKNGD